MAGPPQPCQTLPRLPTAAASARPPAGPVGFSTTSRRPVIESPLPAHPPSFCFYPVAVIGRLLPRVGACCGLTSLPWAAGRSAPLRRAVSEAWWRVTSDMLSGYAIHHDRACLVVACGQPVSRTCLSRIVSVCTTCQSPPAACSWPRHCLVRMNGLEPAHGEHLRLRSLAPIPVPGFLYSEDVLPALSHRQCLN